MTDPRESVSFDRAADYYDRTRSVDPEVLRAMLDVLSDEVWGRGRVLEIGVGTGVLALPLAERGVPLVAVDLSRPMLDKIAEKSGGSSPFPLLQADATALPLADDSVGAAYVRWVLHLIPEWRRALAELVRAVRPGGVIVIEPGGYHGPWREVWLRFRQSLGEPARPVGLDMADPDDQLDQVMTELGARRRRLPEVLVSDRSISTSIEELFEGIEQRRYSWTWRATDDELGSAIAEVRPWAIERFSNLEAASDGVDSVTIWRAYDLSG